LIGLIINHLTEHGVMVRLYCTNLRSQISPHMAQTTFASDEVDRLLEVLDKVRASAEAA